MQLFYYVAEEVDVFGVVGAAAEDGVGAGVRGGGEDLGLGGEVGGVTVAVVVVGVGHFEVGGWGVRCFGVCGWEDVDLWVAVEFVG